MISKHGMGSCLQMLEWMPGIGRHQRRALMMQMHRMLVWMPQRQEWTGQSLLQKDCCRSGCFRKQTLMS